MFTRELVFYQGEFGVVRRLLRGSFLARQRHKFCDRDSEGTHSNLHLLAAPGGCRVGAAVSAGKCQGEATRPGLRDCAAFYFIYIYICFPSRPMATRHFPRINHHQTNIFGTPSSAHLRSDLISLLSAYRPVLRFPPAGAGANTFQSSPCSDGFAPTKSSSPLSNHRL